MKDKILVISYRAPYPIKSGEKIRMFQNIIMLSEIFEIDLVYLNDNPKNTKIEALNEYCTGIYSFNLSKWKSCIKAVILLLFRKSPLQVGYYSNSKLKKWINNNINKYSLVFCNHIRTAQYAVKIDKVKILDYVDCNTMNLSNKKKIENMWLKKMLYLLEYKMVKQYEKEVSKYFTKLIVISERDKEYMKMIGITKEINVVYNYARDLGYMKAKINYIEKPLISFIGKMSTEPNINAVVFFVKHIFPEIKKICTNLEFNIIGTNPTMTISKMNKIEGINVLGFIDNPGEIISYSNIIVAPMISGSGLQNKIIESMYMGKLVITTPIGADGLENITGEEIVVAKTKEDFIKKIIYYLDSNNKEEVEIIGKKAREYILEKYSYESVHKQFINCILVNNQ